MADDFRILKTGGELSGSGNGSNNNNNNSNWLFIGCTLIVAVGSVVLAYNYGKNSVAPKLKAANDEKVGITNAMGNCPVYKKAVSKSESETSQVAKEA